jgi:hypothetical protein
MTLWPTAAVVQSFSRLFAYIGQRATRWAIRVQLAGGVGSPESSR